MPDQYDELARELLPCWCIDEYKDRGLVQPDCPCQFRDDVAAKLRAAAEAQRCMAEKWSAQKEQTRWVEEQRDDACDKIIGLQERIAALQKELEDANSRLESCRANPSKG